MAGANEDILAKVEPGLKFHMDEVGVPQDLQILARKIGYDSVCVFADLDDAKEAACAALKEELLLNYNEPGKTSKHGVSVKCLEHLPAAVGSPGETQIGSQAGNPYPAHSDN